MQQPSVGRRVHYVSHGTPVCIDGTQAFKPKSRAAIVTEVDENDPSRVGLCVINPTGFFFHPLADGGSTYDETAQTGGSWQWPPRA